MEEWKLGFDIGGTKCAAILGKADGGEITVVAKKVYATAEMPTPFACIDRFCAECETLLKEFPEASPTSIGISCGGPLDSRKGIIMSPPNLPGWDDIPVCEILEKRFKMPVRLCNDADGPGPWRR